MSLLSMIVFEELLNLKKECIIYKIDSKEYSDCVKLKKLTTFLLEKLEQENKEAFKYFQQLQNSEKFQQYLQMLEYFHTIINSNIDKYIPLSYQEQIIKDIFLDIDTNEFNDLPPFE